jgi:hypothetical protein
MIAPTENPLLLFQIRNGDIEKGPYTKSQLRSMWDSGLITADTICWRDGLPSWILVAEALEDTPALLSTEAPIPLICRPTFDPLSLPKAPQLFRLLALAFDVSWPILIVAQTDNWMRNCGLSRNLLDWTTATAFIIIFLVRDGLFNGRGVGKWVFRIVVLDIVSKKPCSLFKSIQRNGIPLLTFAILGGLIGLFSLLLGQMASIAGAGILIATIHTLYNGINRDNFRTTYDRIAGTYVVRSKDLKMALKSNIMTD